MKCYGKIGKTKGQQEMLWEGRKCYGRVGYVMGWQEMLWGGRQCQGQQEIIWDGKDMTGVVQTGYNFKKRELFSD